MLRHPQESAARRALRIVLVAGIAVAAIAVHPEGASAAPPPRRRLPLRPALPGKAPLAKPGAAAKPGPSTPPPASAAVPPASPAGSAPAPTATPSAPGSIAATRPPAPTSWEELTKDAVALPGLENLALDAEPLLGGCAKEPDDVSRRQCELIRAWHVERIRGTRYAAVADGAALASSPYDPSEKNVTLSVRGCLDCRKPVHIAGAPRLLATRAPRGFAEGAPLGLEMADHEVPLPDPKKGKLFADKVAAKLKVEFVFTLGEPFESGHGAGATHGLTIVPLGHRVYNACTGEVVASSPASSKPKEVARDMKERDPGCAALDAPTEEEKAEAAAEAQLPDTLTREDIERTMAPVGQRVRECAHEYELKGVAKVLLTLNGDGANMQIKIQPPFDKGEASLCLRQALKSASFPKFKKSKPLLVEYPFVLHN